MKSEADAEGTGPQPRDTGPHKLEDTGRILPQGLQRECGPAAL